MIIIFSHSSDLAGHCSGEIIRRENPDAKLIGVNYDEPLDRSIITDGDIVFVVDFSFTYDEMKWLYDNCFLIWIDHHKSSIKMMDKLGHPIAGIQEIGMAACSLCWKYLHGDKSIPYFINLLSDYDVWDHENPEVLQFQYGIRLHENTHPGSEIWDQYFEDVSDWGLEYTSVQKTLANGKLILDYKTSQNTKYAASMAYEAEFEGYRAIVINKPFSNSKIFDSVYDPYKHDIMIIFGCKEIGSLHKYSLYSNKPDIDVSKIAVKYGGGGHKGAAWFHVKYRVV